MLFIFIYKIINIDIFTLYFLFDRTQFLHKTKVCDFLALYEWKNRLEFPSDFSYTYLFCYYDFGSSFSIWIIKQIQISIVCKHKLSSQAKIHFLFIVFNIWWIDNVDFFVYQPLHRIACYFSLSTYTEYF